MSEQLPSGLEKYAETAVFTQDSMPEKITKQHRTKDGAWGRIVVLEGELDYVIAGAPDQVHRLSPGIDGIIRPTEPHHVAKVGPVSFRIEFYRAKPA